MRELGWYPVQLFVVQQIVRFMNKLWGMHERTLARRALQESWELYLLDDCRENWCAKLHVFMESAGIQPAGYLPGVAVPIPVYDERTVLRNLRAACHQVFLTSGLPPKVAAYHADFGSEFADRWGRAAYLNLPLSLHKLRVLARFRLSCHHLLIEVGRWHGVPSDACICPLCSSGAVQDEHHVLFRCHALHHVRQRYPRLFATQHQFTHIRALFNVANLDDWLHVACDLYRFFVEVGGIYQPLHLPTVAQPAPE